MPTRESVKEGCQKEESICINLIKWHTFKCHVNQKHTGRQVANLVKNGERPTAGLWPTHLRVGLDDSCGSAPTQNILWICEIYEHRIIHLISLHEHVDDSRGTMAPVNQSVSLIAQRWRVIPRSEFFMTHVVNAWLHQLCQGLLVHICNWLKKTLK